MTNLQALQKKIDAVATENQAAKTVLHVAGKKQRKMPVLKLNFVDPSMPVAIINHTSHASHASHHSHHSHHSRHH